MPAKGLFEDEGGPWRRVPPPELTREEWETRRDAIMNTLDLCPCDNHPGADCSTCRGACSCHYK